MLKVVSDTLNAYTDDDKISISMIDAGILATLQEGNDVPPFVFRLPPTVPFGLAREASL